MAKAGITMETKYWSVDPNVDASHPSIQEAAQLLREGKLVAFPTETVYGLGADARSTAAVERIFAAKGRPSDNPLIVHIADRAQLDALVCDVGAIAERLIARFWPGPLTLVLRARPGAVSPKVTAGLDTVAVRMPQHPVATALIAAAGCPVAAPSANRSGRPSPTRAAHVKGDLDGAIDGIVDAGPAGVGLESTVAEVVDGRIHILRPGAITAEQLQQVAEVSFDESHHESSANVAPRTDAPMSSALLVNTPKSPGMKYSHYAPKGLMTLIIAAATVSPSTSDCPASHAVDSVVPLAPDNTASPPSAPQHLRWMQEQLDQAAAKGLRTGVFTYAEHAAFFRADLVIACGSLSDPDSTAYELYDSLREFDECGIAYILAEACPEQGIGEAIMNRLRKASGNRIVQL